MLLAVVVDVQEDAVDLGEVLQGLDLERLQGLALRITRFTLPTIARQSTDACGGDDDDRASMDS